MADTDDEASRDMVMSMNSGDIISIAYLDDD